MNLRLSPSAAQASDCARGFSTFWLLILLLMGLISLPGCGGCWGSNPAANAKKKEEEAEKEKEKKRKKKLEKPKDDFEPLAVRMLPSNDPSPTVKQPPVLVKPGHWIAVSETAKANNFDFPGELAAFVEQNATNQPLEVEDTTARLSSWCPAILPKGQSKRIESLFYVPRRDAAHRDLGRIYSVRSELRGMRGGRTETFSTTLGPSLKDYEHLIVVLVGGSATPASYAHLDKLISVRAPQVEANENETLRHYHVVRPTIEKSAPLPSHPLAWTTIAYVFWDDLDPAVLTNQQQAGLVDWIHWGGQLIISGPNSLDKLKASFLAPYLPATAKQTIKLGQADFDELNTTYSISRDPVLVAKLSEPPKGENLRRIAVSDERPMIGIETDLSPSAQSMAGTGGLVVERRVGGGRIVATRFPLTDVRIKQWKSFDNFFNAVLLRRPPRVFDQENQIATLTIKWDRPGLEQMLLEPRLGSTLRYFSRDIGFPTDEPWDSPSASAPPENESEQAAAPANPRASGGMSGAPVYGAPGMAGGMMPFGYNDFNHPRPDTFQVHPGIDDWHFCGYQSSDPSGVAAWNDHGAASEAARQILTEAAGIEIPQADFVLKVLAVYLFVLVPVNGFVFWLIGRVEWAWIAAPIIAIVGAGAVIRLAQLDIGFARSRTEIAILEMQGGYERAHLTRYTALYTSLSSNYTVAFDEPSALATPFAAERRNESLLSIEQYTDVRFRRDKEASLAGVQVSSNSTGMVHSEQILPLGTSPKVTETLTLTGDDKRGYSVRNTTDLVLRDVGVFRRVPPAQGEAAAHPRIESAYIAELKPATSELLRFSHIREPQPQSFPRTGERKPGNRRRKDRSDYPAVWLDTWDKVPIFARGPIQTSDETLEKTRIRLTRLARLATDRLRLLPGDVRLVGWTDQHLPGMRVQPAAPQNVTYTLVLAHLARGPLAAAGSDHNVADDYVNPIYLDPEPEPEAAQP